MCDDDIREADFDQTPDQESLLAVKISSLDMREVRHREEEHYN